MKYRGGEALALKRDFGLIIIPGPQTNHYFVNTTYTEKTYTIDGKLVHQQYNLKPMLKSLHERAGSAIAWVHGWPISCAMVFFSLSGLIMWSVPRVHKVKGLVESWSVGRTRPNRPKPAH